MATAINRSVHNEIYTTCQKNGRRWRSQPRSRPTEVAQSLTGASTAAGEVAARAPGGSTTDNDGDGRSRRAIFRSKSPTTGLMQYENENNCVHSFEMVITMSQLDAAPRRCHEISLDAFEQARPYVYRHITTYRSVMTATRKGQS